MRVGRAFFWPKESSELSLVAYQPLENHRGNIIRFVEQWKRNAVNPSGLPGEFLDDGVWGWIHEAATNHDRGKAETFRIIHERRNGPFEYSFRGHRFRTPGGMSLFAKLVEQGHHDYSTPEIAKAVARIRRDGTQEEQRLSHAFPEALYILSMCDQIEAETAVRTFYGESESRAFLDFILYGPESRNTPFPFGKQATFFLDPFPFQEPLTNTVQYWVWENPPHHVDELTMVGKGRDIPENLSIRTVEVTLCPLA